MNIAVCIASGPSLTKEDVEFCQGKAKVYVVNDCYKLAPWADVLYSCDLKWWNYHQGVQGFKGEKWTLSFQAAQEWGLNHIGSTDKKPWSNRPDVVATGNNSGFQCLNMAANRHDTVILLGYDMKLGENKKRHWFGDHPQELLMNSQYHKWVENFNKAAPRIDSRVINCTRDTALECFERMTLEQAFYVASP